MNRGNNELLETAISELDRADFRAEMIFALAVLLAVVLAGVFL